MSDEELSLVERRLLGFVGLNDGAMTLEFRNLEGDSAEHVKQLRSALESGATITISAPMLVAKMDSFAEGIFFTLRLRGAPKIR